LAPDVCGLGQSYRGAGLVTREDHPLRRSPKPRVRRSDIAARGRKLVTLRDAATYITALLKKEAAEPEWQAAIEALMLVVELAGPR